MGAHQQNVNQSGSHTQTSQTLRSTAPVLLSTSRCSQAPLELSKVLWDSTREFSGAPSRIVKFWSCWDLCAGLRETSRAAETSVQLYGRLDAIFSQQWFLGFHDHKAFRLSYSCLLQSQDSLHHNMACIMYLSDYIYTYGQSACRRYSSVIGVAPGDADWDNVGMHLEAFVARKSVSHHRLSIWQGEASGGHTEIMEKNWSCRAFIDPRNLCGSSCTFAEPS